MATTNSRHSWLKWQDGHTKSCKACGLVATAYGARLAEASTIDLQWVSARGDLWVGNNGDRQPLCNVVRASAQAIAENAELATRTTRRASLGSEPQTQGLSRIQTVEARLAWLRRREQQLQGTPEARKAAGLIRATEITWDRLNKEQAESERIRIAQTLPGVEVTEAEALTLELWDFEEQLYLMSDVPPSAFRELNSLREQLQAVAA